MTPEAELQLLKHLYDPDGDVSVPAYLAGIGHGTVGAIFDTLTDAAWTRREDDPGNIHLIAPDRNAFVSWRPERPLDDPDPIRMVVVGGADRRIAWHAGFPDGVPEELINAFCAALSALPARVRPPGTPGDPGPAFEILTGAGWTRTGDTGTHTLTAPDNLATITHTTDPDPDPAPGAAPDGGARWQVTVGNAQFTGSWEVEFTGPIPDEPITAFCAAMTTDIVRHPEDLPDHVRRPTRTP
ncbi:DUF317 domain-containing protein (plasmid) [Embleya sp. NBC_00888]|uniref:DUF317 domain-containing protein n=1 Tax=Embleya sp. NBC_00888 TaxID=2975960 RepID=UPI002F90DD74|nr:DUF317 domain-containing protein [Embleya sp. NBC_00888]